jgi:hypothetical protein
MTDLDDLVAAYIGCALWSSSIEEDFANWWVQRHPNERKPAPDVSMESFGFTADDLDEAAGCEIREDCESFLSAMRDDLTLYREQRSLRNAGHDFWLTRNGHGAGFWDRGLGALGERLTEMAKPYGDQTLYVSDDERIHIA